MSLLKSIYLKHIHYFSLSTQNATCYMQHNHSLIEKLPHPETVIGYSTHTTFSAPNTLYPIQTYLLLLSCNAFYVFNISCSFSVTNPLHVLHPLPLVSQLLKAINFLEQFVIYSHIYLTVIYMLQHIITLLLPTSTGKFATFCHILYQTHSPVYIFC